MDMIEKVAMALFASERSYAAGRFDRLWEKLPEANYEKDWGEGPVFVEPGKESYRKRARAAIEAMRGPTPSMLNAAPATKSETFKAIWPAICGDVYRAMIDAALTEAAPSTPDLRQQG